MFIELAFSSLMYFYFDTGTFFGIVSVFGFELSYSTRAQTDEIYEDID